MASRGYFAVFATAVVTVGVGAGGARLSAQASHTISPAGFGPVSGGNTTGYPWGTGTIATMRYQQIHDDLAGPARVITGLAVRRKELGGDWPALSPRLQLDVSTASVSSQLATATFANNHGANRTTVMASKLVNFPAVNAPIFNLPAPFTYVMMFDQPFTHAGTRGICWEVLVTANNYTQPTVLELDLAHSGLTRNQPFGLGCGGAALRGDYAAPLLSQSASGFTPNANAMLLVGTDNESFAGQPLPLDLSNFNAVTCSLFVAPLLALPLAVDGAGNAMFSANVSGLGPDLVVNTQVVGENTAIPLGLAFTNGLFQAPSVPATFMRNWAVNTSLPNGNLQKFVALVTEFLHP